MIQLENSEMVALHYKNRIYSYQCKNAHMSGFGKLSMIDKNFWIITEPFADTGGNVWIFRLRRDEGPNLVSIVSRPDQQNEQPVGFGQMIRVIRGFVMILDTYWPGFCGSIFYYPLRANAKLSLLCMNSTKYENSWQNFHCIERQYQSPPKPIGAGAAATLLAVESQYQSLPKQIGAVAAATLSADKNSNNLCQLEVHSMNKKSFSHSVEIWSVIKLSNLELKSMSPLGMNNTSSLRAGSSESEV